MTEPSSRRRPGPQSRAAGASSRLRILTEALHEFSLRGFRAASIGAVASAAGVSQSGLLHHFPSKQDLLAAVIEEHRHQHATVFLDSQDDALGFLTGLVRLVERSREEAEVTKLFTMLAVESTSPDHPAHGWAVERYRATRAYVAEAVERAQRSGVLRPDVPPIELAGGLLAAMDGVQLQWLLEGDDLDPAALFAVLVERMVPSLVSDTAAGSAAAARSMHELAPWTRPRRAPHPEPATEV